MSAAPWVLLRGLMRDARHWGAFPAQFAAAVPGGSIITLDLPGNGSRHQERSARSVPAMARWVRAELARRDVAPPYRVLAMSLGAMVAVAWAEIDGEEIERLVLVNTSLKPFSPFWQRLQPRAWPTVLRTALLAPSTRVSEAAILRLTSQAHSDDARLLDQWVQWHEARPVHRANALRQLLAAASYRAPRETPHPALLLLTSAGDALVDHRCTLALADRWQAPVRVHPSAGHDLPLDDGPWVADEIARWLSSES